MFTAREISKCSIVCSLVIVLSFALLSCGGGGGGGVAGPQLVTLATVTAMYPNNGANWNDYVKGKTIVAATDTLCSAATDTACIHGGEVRVVTVTGKTSCSGLTASDALGAFNWTCDAGTGTARMISTGLKDGKYLSDLLDFTTPAWKTNSATVYSGGSAYGATPTTAWWANPISTANSGGSLGTAGTIYAVTTSATATYTIDASRVALVSKPGTTITGPGGAFIRVVSEDSQNFIWIEGVVDALGNDIGISLNFTKFSVLRNVTVKNANGTNKRGLLIYGSSYSRYADIEALGNGETGIWISSSNGNSFSNIKAVGNGLRGLYLYQSLGEVLRNVTAVNNTDSGIYVQNSDRSTLAGISTSNNGQYGLAIISSYDGIVENIIATSNQLFGIYSVGANFIFADVTAALNFEGIEIGSNQNTVMNLAAIKNTGSGLSLSSSSSNTLANIASAHNPWDIYSSNSSTNTYTGLLKVAGVGGDTCYENGGINPGIVSLTCANSGSSNATLTTDVTVTGAVMAKVTTTDMANASNVNGAALFTSITDWTLFSNGYRSWGLDGSDFPNANNARRCASGTCRIWDWSLLATDTVMRSVLPVPTGSNTLTHTWSNASTTTFLRNAVEIIGDGIGNDNGLCESGETCLYTPNIGAYQGHGNLISAGPFTNGTITGVTLMRYETNGR